MRPLCDTAAQQTADPASSGNVRQLTEFEPEKINHDRGATFRCAAPAPGNSRGALRGVRGSLDRRPPVRRRGRSNGGGSKGRSRAGTGQDSLRLSFPLQHGSRQRPGRGSTGNRLNAVQPMDQMAVHDRAGSGQQEEQVAAALSAPCRGPWGSPLTARVVRPSIRGLRVRAEYAI